MIKNSTKNQKYALVLLIIYLIALTYFMFFAEAFGRGVNENNSYAYNLELFKEIKRFYVHREQLGLNAFLLNIWGNVIAFMPFGFFIPIISKGGRIWYHTIFLSFVLSLCMETIQLFLKVGSFDVDDLFLNTLGGILGYLVYQVVQMIRRILCGKR